MRHLLFRWYNFHSSQHVVMEWDAESVGWLDTFHAVKKWEQTRFIKPSLYFPHMDESVLCPKRKDKSKFQMAFWRLFCFLHVFSLCLNWLFDTCSHASTDFCGGCIHLHLHPITLNYPTFCFKGSLIRQGKKTCRTRICKAWGHRKSWDDPSPSSTFSTYRSRKPRHFLNCRRCHVPSC